jgi:hypothetical protein
MVFSCPRLPWEGESRPLKDCVPLLAAHLSLVKRKDKPSHVCLEGNVLGVRW